MPQVVEDLLAPDEPPLLHGFYEGVPRDPSKIFEAQILFDNFRNGRPGHQEVSGLAPDADGEVGLDLGDLGLQAGDLVPSPFFLVTWIMESSLLMFLGGKVLTLDSRLVMKSSVM